MDLDFPTSCSRHLGVPTISCHMVGKWERVNEPGEKAGVQIWALGAFGSQRRAESDHNDGCIEVSHSSDFIATTGRHTRRDE